MKVPIAIALDAPDDLIAIAWAKAVAPYLSTAKIGLELFVRYGPVIVERIRESAPDLEIFLDLKLHDIPNTVAGAAQSAARLRPEILTVHAGGSREMVSAAVAALPDTQIAAVTVLTSLSDEQLSEMNCSVTAAEQAIALAKIAVEAGARAIVCSPAEVHAMRAHLGSTVRLITPGVRPQGTDAGDQTRVATPQEALASGADLLVIGRPITGAYKSEGVMGVAKAAEAIAQSLR